MYFTVIVFAFCLIVLLQSVTGISVCPSGLQRHANTSQCFKYYQSGDRDWQSARSYCQSVHDDLLTIKDDQLFRKIKAENSQSKVWLGAIRCGNSFQWIDGRNCCPGEYWAAGEPNNNDGEENCVNMWHRDDRLGLNDQHCGDKMGFICEEDECKIIDNCADPYCTKRALTKCRSCFYNNDFFKLTTGNTKCERQCERNDHYCWPGVCTGGFTKNCVCEPGFHKVSSGDTETKCQLDHDNKASIVTCATSLFNVNGKGRSSDSNTSSTECKYRQDFYGNFKPYKIVYDFVAEFSLNESDWKKPAFIQESHFGVTDATIVVVRRDISGTSQDIVTKYEVRDTSNSTKAQRLFSAKTNMALPSYTISDGDRLCMRYEVRSGGYVQTKNTHLTTHTVNGPEPYDKTKASREICYRYDSSTPVHCLWSKTCSYEPLQIDRRITSDFVITVKFDGWRDPVPFNGNAAHASGIESYEITVNEVVPPNGTLGSSIFSKKVGALVRSLTLNLSTDIPKLYCITLEVKDVADNIKQARRFVLYDNTSAIKTMNESLFTITSASQQSNYTWQTHHNELCINWQNYFYNDFYLDNELLNPIQPSNQISESSIYEQNAGVLPVKGTDNVNGLVQFKTSWSLNNMAYNNEEITPTVYNQQHCEQLGISDGDTVVWQVHAIDIVGNSLVKNRTVNIDRSVPDVNNIFLMKNSERLLFVHDSIDLSTMILYFEALDRHSGLLKVEWQLGTSNGGSELGQGALSVKRIEEVSCPSDVKTCYCPSVGKCEFYNYTISLNKLVEAGKHEGDHNRNYYFKIKVTNHAMLTNFEHLEILVDESPPEQGVVLEGPLNNPDIDYTSNTKIMVHWHGFIDHESGIKTYKVAIAEECLTYYDMNNSSSNISSIIDIRDLPYTENDVNLHIGNFTGKMYTTVVAFNNAMEPSKPVCSDGITRDIARPGIANISLQNAKWSESIFCQNDTAWLLRSNMKKVPLMQSSQCRKLCLSLNDTTVDMLQMLPVESRSNENDVSDFLCQNLPTYDPNNFIFLPNDHISIRWDMTDIGTQVDELYVGFGKSTDDINLPSILRYMETNRQTFFNRRHVGLGPKDPFFILVKAVNKARMETIVKFGPVMIDDTPPKYRFVPAVTNDNKYLIVSWDNQTFYDDEQSTPIDDLYFQIKQNTFAVTSLLEWTLSVSKSCSSAEFCFKYPLEIIQKQDTDLGLDFHISIYIYNKAGHFTIVDTAIFKLPSMYSPGHGIIVDTDPEIQTQSDIDIHFTLQKLCASWKGFHHHENVSYEIGIGMNETMAANIVPYQFTENGSSACIQSLNLKYDVKYFFLVKASCSGGSTISSSNGVNIYDERQSLSLKVFGQDLNTRIEETIVVQNASEAQFCFIDHVKTGYKYNLRIIAQSVFIINTTSTAADIIFSASNGRTHDYHIVPYGSKPCFHFATDTILNENITVVLNYSATDYVLTMEKLHLYWNCTILGTAPSFEIALFETYCPGNLQETCLDIVTPFGLSDAPCSSVMNIDNLVSNVSYIAALRTCSSVRCSNYTTLSAAFQVETFPPSGTIASSKLALSGPSRKLLITAVWNPFFSTSGITMYLWTVSSDVYANHVLLQWSKVVTTNMANAQEQVNTTVDLPVHAYSTLYFCVKAFSGAGTSVVVCNVLSGTQPESYISNVVYDFDSSSEIWPTVKQMLHSSNPGSQYTLLHNEELDFGQDTTTPTGAMLYSDGRNVTWYLMTTQHLLSSRCDNPSCVSKITTDTGFVIFNKDLITINRVHYICAAAKTTEIHREHFIETLEAVNACSNGFVLDNVPPTKGVINVRSNNGYLNSNTIFASWCNFTDNVDATSLGYLSKIHDYSYSLGTYAGGDDLKCNTNVGQDEYIWLTNETHPDGTPIFITVTATDHAGLSTEVVSEELIVDTSAPKPGSVTVHGVKRNSGYINSRHMKISHDGCGDAESGLDFFIVGLGTRNDTMDIVLGQHYYTNEIEFDLIDDRLKDGLSFYLLSQGVNRAGLSSRFVSRRLTLDLSPPQGGHVLDGLWLNEKDLDYQTDLTHIGCHWKGFVDAHSGIDHYEVALGTLRYTDDIGVYTDIDLRTDYRWNSTFVPGQKYYCSVIVYNGADSYVTHSSDGIILDNSPPTHGIVRIGSASKHSKYHSQRQNLHIHWMGFEDPQSDIYYFESCLGLKRGTCDISPFSNNALQSNIILTNLQLPLGQDIFATVKATNRVGLSTTQSSDSFQIDETPPEIIENPTFISYSIARNNKLIQWDPSVLKLKWVFTDIDSPIVNHILTLKTYHEGHNPKENILIGSSNSYAMMFEKDNLLHNGDTYYIDVTSCNAAGLCITASTEDILIDSTRPHVGGFKPSLTWRNINTSFPSHVKAEMTLTWYGFFDQESGIIKYHLTASKTYSGQELTNGIIPVQANQTLPEQTHTFNLQRAVMQNEKVVLSIWAENNVGLNSSVARVTVLPIPSTSILDIYEQYGNLEIEKHSCEYHYCNKDCTCAIFGQPCTGVASNPCVDVSFNKSVNHNLTIFTNEVKSDSANITSSASCISARWTIDDLRVPIERYEWSAGLEHEPVGEGVFDLKREDPWIDVGRHSHGIHCLPRTNVLEHGQLYLVYVRVWFDSNSFKDFSSEPFVVDHSAPQVGKGTFVKDSSPLCSKDFDVIDWMTTITACWDGVFREQQGWIRYFTVGLGTTTYGCDTYPDTNVGLSTNLTLTDLTLNHGTRYYFTVTSTNNVGLQTSVTSDGFVVDMDDPIAGIVHNTALYTDVSYQCSLSTFSASWTGFLDNFSGIKSYHVTLTNSTNLATMLNTVNFINVGLRTQFTFRNLTLEHDCQYVVLVKAMDAANHVSTVSQSISKTVDITPPKGFDCKRYNVVSKLRSTGENTTVALTGPFLQHVPYRIRGCISNFQDSYSSVILRFGRNRLELPLAVDNNSSKKFQYTFIPNMDTNHSLFLSFNGNPEDVTLDLEECTDMVEVDGDKSVHVRQIGDSVLDVTLNVIDKESGIKKVFLGSGTSPMAYQLQSLQSTDRTTNCILEIDGDHGTPIYVTAIVENHAGLRATFIGMPIVLDKTAPVVSVLSIQADILKANLSLDNYQHPDVFVNVSWDALDEESGIKVCFVGIGSSKGTHNLHDYSPAVNFTFATTLTNLRHGQRVFATIKCINYVAIASIVTSNATIISFEKPSTALVEMVAFGVPTRTLVDRLVNRMAVLPKPYGDSVQSGNSSTIVYVQGNLTSVKLEWWDFADMSGIEHYEYRLRENTDTLVDWTGCGLHTCVEISGLKLVSKHFYTADVRAVNTKQYSSDSVYAQIYTVTNSPQTTGISATMIKFDDDINIDWTSVFTESGMSVTYELTVGTQSGYNDITDEKELKETNFPIKLPYKTTLSGTINELFVVIVCKYATGEPTIYYTNFKI